MEILRYTKSGIPVVGADGNGHNLYLHNCSICNKEFVSKGINAKYCDDCKEANLMNVVDINICLSCGKQFLGRNGYQRYCDECENIKNGNIQTNIKVINNKNCDKTLIQSIIETKVINIINKSKEKGNVYNNLSINYWDVGGFNEGIKNRVRDRDNYVCQICGNDTNLHVHHIIPRRSGGSHELDNLVLLCSSCHMAIETGDINHAIKKCTKNALKTNNLKHDDDIKITDSYKTIILQQCLEDIFDRLSGYDERGDILVDISEVLSKIEN